MAAEPTSATATSLTVEVPYGAVTGSISVTVDGRTGTSSTDFTVPDTEPNDVFGVEEEDVFLVYPNPTENLIRFEIASVSSGATIQLLNTSGRVVYHQVVHQQGSYKGQIDISDLPTGIYILQFKGKNTHIARIISK